MANSSLLLERLGFDRPERSHKGKVIAMRSNLKWCSDGLEFTCWNGDVSVRPFFIEAHDREIIFWWAVASARIRSSDGLQRFQSGFEVGQIVPRPDQADTSWRDKDAQFSQLVRSPGLAIGREIRSRFNHRILGRLIHPVRQIGLAPGAFKFKQRLHTAILDRRFVAVECIA